MTTLLNHLIADEVGTSAFLATILDPGNTDAEFVHAREAIATVFGNCGINFTGTAPSLVLREYLNIDLIVVWKPWTILIENKVTTASITGGQLNDYYSVVLKELKRNSFLKDVGASAVDAENFARQSFCFVYLTPTKFSGAQEFDSLTLDATRSDTKTHLPWPTLLERLKFPREGADSTTISQWFVATGLKRIHQILDEHKNKRLPEDEQRVQSVALMNAFKKQLQPHPDLVGLLPLQRWSDKLKEQLFITGPTHSAYVGVYLSCNGSQLTANKNLIAVGDISFDVAKNHRGRLRDYLNEMSKQEWCNKLNIDSKETRIDIEKGKLCWSFDLRGKTIEEIQPELSKHFLKFVSVFKSVL